MSNMTAVSPVGRAGSPATAAALAVLAIAAATLAGAWYFQLVLGLQPCPLCLEQRYAYYLAIPLAALVAFAAGQNAPRSLLIGGLVILALAALGNAVLAGYHAGVEWKFWAGPTDCSGPVNSIGSTANLLKSLQDIRIVRCDEAAWRLFGISLAGYDVLVSLALAVAAAVGFRAALAQPAE